MPQFPANTGDGYVAFRQVASGNVGIDIFEGAGQLAGGIPPLRIIDPNGNLVASIGVAGGISGGATAANFATKAANYTMVASDAIIAVNASGGTVTITLPPANISTPFSREAIVIKTDTSVNPVVVQRQGADTIFGNLTSVNLQTQNSTLWLQSDGTSNWLGMPQQFPADNNSLKTIAFAQSPYSVAQSDYKILANATAGAITVNLPAANTVPAGSEFRIEKIDASANAVTVTRAGADTIEGANTVALAAQFNTVRVSSDSVSEWWKL